MNSINPATIRTSFLIPLGVPEHQTQNAYDQMRIGNLVGRLGEVADTSTAIAFLANDKTASFITGLLLPVDGGVLTGSPPH